MPPFLIGTDLLHIPKIERLLKNPQAAKKVFHPSELRDNRPEHLAGVFAAKEAFFKALRKKPKWLDIEVKTKRSGKPELKLNSPLENGWVADVSISHDGDYAIAVAVLTKKNDNSK